MLRTADGDWHGALLWAEDSLCRHPWYLWVHGYALRTAATVAAQVHDPRAARWRPELTEVTGRAQLDPALTQAAAAAAAPPTTTARRARAVAPGSAAVREAAAAQEGTVP